MQIQGWRSLLGAVLGVVVGSALGWNVARLGRETPPPCPAAAVPAQCEVAAEPHVSQVPEKIASPGASRLRQQPITTEPSSTPPNLTEPDSDGENAAESTHKDAIAWRISAIEKFIPLNDDQRARLRRSFEQKDGNPNEEAGARESLDEIIGAENAELYRQQVRQAFSRMQEEEVEKEVVWLSRQLNLSPDVEGAMRRVYSEVEGELREQRRLEETEGAAHSRQQRVQEMVSEQKRREQLLLERMRPVLSPDQYQGYARIQAESSSSDMQVFHGG